MPFDTRLWSAVKLSGVHPAGNLHGFDSSNADKGRLGVSKRKERKELIIQVNGRVLTEQIGLSLKT